MFFPLFVNIENKEVLIIGGGKIGGRKAQTLREYGGNITVYSEKVMEEIILADENIKVVNKNVSHDKAEIKELVKKYFLVVAATDDTELNDRISHVCMSENILVNNASSKTEMNAMFTAVVKNDEFQIGIGSYGKSCRRSKALKGKVQELIDEISKTEKEVE
ncbi:MAG: bifunctional precorrin-2 dehydrogenase/sirohydrochlorin ferrochelatase [Leptotrichia sp.]|nr:bifunctional precorrin-2 dehydrogenase/sirohydrochlorin ferrochelatase [Leptotrichia sp.]